MLCIGQPRNQTSLAAPAPPMAPHSGPRVQRSSAPAQHQQCTAGPMAHGTPPAALRSQGLGLQATTNVSPMVIWNPWPCVAVGEHSSTFTVSDRAEPVSADRQWTATGAAGCNCEPRDRHSTVTHNLPPHTQPPPMSMGYRSYKGLPQQPSWKPPPPTPTHPDTRLRM